MRIIGQQEYFCHNWIIIYTLYSTCIDPYPGKKAKLLSLTLWLTEAPPMKMKHQSIIPLVTASYFF